ncbi:hypothetical protein-putative related to sulfatases [hydrothermal vent metagenome]|uniref:DUF1501 domain-containing protein n=1 Tax=hydrothermal vent metagenome TaxID=652676 RepID=A0A3B1DQ09_9ZZZZ
MTMSKHQQKNVSVSSRRNWLKQAGVGFGALALNCLLQQEEASAKPKNPLAAKKTHQKATAKSVIFLFMEGGPSHIDLFDPKPMVNRLAGQSLPKSFKRPVTAMGEVESPILASPRQWKQHGESGLWISEWLPHIAQCADDLAVLRGCHTNGINHAGGVCQMNTVSPLAGRPSLGSWVSYGLGSENESLPAFVVMQDDFKKTIVNGSRNWGTAFMPAAYQGTRLENGETPIPNLFTPKGISRQQQQGKLDFLNQLNRQHAKSREQQSELEAKILSYELAFRMQVAAPDAVDITKETKQTINAYGLHQKETASFGRNCLLARRLVERGVRFVQLYSGAGSQWDQHSKIEEKHSKMCLSMDQGVGALLNDLKQRGLLDETLVVWGGEFGRTPMSEKGDGRDHNPTGFTMWMAGGGVKGGQAIGATDELGLYAVEDQMHIKDIHTSIYHLLGLNNMKLEYRHMGRPERPTLNEGEFQKKLITG